MPPQPPHTPCLRLRLTRLQNMSLYGAGTRLERALCLGGSLMPLRIATPEAIPSSPLYALPPAALPLLPRLGHVAKCPNLATPLTESLLMEVQTSSNNTVYWTNGQLDPVTKNLTVKVGSLLHSCYICGQHAAALKQGLVPE